MREAARALRLALALAVLGLLCRHAARAAVPSGATTSLEGLRQAYIRAVKTHDEAALESLFDLTPLTPKERAQKRRHFLTTELKYGITDAVLESPDPDFVKSVFTDYHVHFEQPVIGILETTFDTHFVQGMKYNLGTSSGRYYILCPVLDRQSRSARWSQR